MPRILCLTSNPLNRAASGAAVRAQNIFQLLARLGPVQVVLASAWDEELRDADSSLPGVELIDVIRFQFRGTPSINDRLRQEFDGRYLKTVGYQALPNDVRRLQALMANHDLVWIYGLRIPNAFGLWRWPHTVLDLDDIPSCVHQTAMIQASGWLEKMREYRQVILWRRREKLLLERFDAIVSASETDRDKLRRTLGRSERLHVVPNGYAKPKQTPVRRPVAPPRVGFVGTFKYQPNRDGTRWFIDNVWPGILQTVPQARLRLVGDGSEKETWQTSKNIDALGWVADTESEMATWSLTIVPIFVGGGTRVKTAEAFSRKCPIVSTTLGVYGYDVVDGREVLIADSAQDFAAKCLRILLNPTDGEMIAEKGWQKFLEHWTWDSSADRIADIVQKMLQKKTSHSMREVVSAR